MTIEDGEKNLRNYFPISQEESKQEMSELPVYFIKKMHGDLTNGRSAVVWRCKRPPRFSMRTAHMHSFYEIYILLSGTRSFFIEDSVYQIQKGDVVFIKSGVLHKNVAINDEEHERVDIIVPVAVVEWIVGQYGAIESENLFQTPILTLSASGRRYILGIIDKLEREEGIGDLYSQEMKRSLFREMLLFLMRLSSISQPMEPDSLYAIDEMTQKAIYYIKDNFMRQLSLSEVAEHVGLSGTYFSKKFKKDTGIGFKEYLLNIRIKRACEQLLTTKRSITDIAYESGFNDSNYFGDAFKKIVGCSPQMFRRSMQ